MASDEKNVLALTGGVGGAKLALGLGDVVPPGRLHILVNTGDDFEHLGLHISPDIDTLLYTLSDLANKVQGWGVADETYNALGALEHLGAESWFLLGDKDLATHLWRTSQLKLGRSLGDVTADLATRLGIDISVYPMTDQPVPTMVHCADGVLGFQHYFVRERCEPAVSGFTFEGIEDAQPNARILQLLDEDAFSDIIVCPSNPFVSVDPILQLPGLWERLRDASANVTIVSPIVAGIAIKGPAAKMMGELSMPVTALGVAEHYQAKYPGLVNNFVIDESDGTLRQNIEQLGLRVGMTSTVMKSRQDKRNLAQFVLESGLS
jgi:LPPG:FO 2-phospho-L-lactate transferase